MAQAEQKLLLEPVSLKSIQERCSKAASDRSCKLLLVKVVFKTCAETCPLYGCKSFLCQMNEHQDEDELRYLHSTPPLPITPNMILLKCLMGLGDASSKPSPFLAQLIEFYGVSSGFGGHVHLLILPQML